MAEIFAAFSILAGVALVLIASIGVLRLPDALCRAHAITKALSLGIVLMLIGYWIYLDTDVIAWKIVLAIVFQFLTIPVAGHLLSLVVLEKELPRWKERPIDKDTRFRK